MPGKKRSSKKKSSVKKSKKGKRAAGRQNIKLKKKGTSIRSSQAEIDQRSNSGGGFEDRPGAGLAGDGGTHDR